MDILLWLKSHVWLGHVPGLVENNFYVMLQWSLQFLVSTFLTNFLNINESMMEYNYPALPIVYFPIVLDSWFLTNIPSNLRKLVRQVETSAPNF